MGMPGNALKCLGMPRNARANVRRWDQRHRALPGVFETFTGHDFQCLEMHCYAFGVHWGCTEKAWECLAMPGNASECPRTQGRVSGGGISAA